MKCALAAILALCGAACADPPPTRWPDAIDGIAHVEITTDHPIHAPWALTLDGEWLYDQILPWNDTMVEFQARPVDGQLLDTWMGAGGDWYYCGEFLFEDGQFIGMSRNLLVCSAQVWSGTVPEPRWLGVIALAAIMGVRRRALLAAVEHAPEDFASCKDRRSDHRAKCPAEALGKSF
jgi:hypothetical protein